MRLTHATIRREQWARIVAVDAEEPACGIKNSRTEYAVDLLATLLVRAQAYLTSRRLRKGFPQLAVFSFDYIGARISAFGRYERDELEALLAFLGGKQLLHGGACIDAGANIGNHAVFFADHFAVIHAFEPAPRPFSLLQHNAALKQNIRCHNLGLSDRPHTASLTAPVYNLGRGSISIAIPETDMRVSTPIQLVPLDSVDAIRGLDVELLKIDVEGHELAVLDGAAELIARTGPAIVFEQQPAEISDGSSPTIDRLRALGYKQFYSSCRTPQHRSKLLTILVRMICGETIKFERVSAFGSKYYPMIVAIK